MHEEFYGLKKEEPKREEFEDAAVASLAQDSTKEGTPLKSAYEVALERSEQMSGASELGGEPTSEDIESTREMDRPEFANESNSESAEFTPVESAESVEPNESQAEGGQVEDIETSQRMKNLERGEEIRRGMNEGFKNKFGGVAEKAKAVKEKVQGFFSRLFGSANNKVSETVGAVANGVDQISEKASVAYSEGKEKMASCKDRCVEGLKGVQSKTIERIQNSRLAAEQKLTLMKALNMLNQTESVEDLNEAREAEHQRVDEYYDEQIEKRKNAEKCLSLVIGRMTRQG